MKTRSLRLKTALAAIALPAALAACADGTLPDYNILGALRVVALRADQPEVAPGTSVTVTAVVSDLIAGRSLQQSAVGCIDPGVGYGAQATCEGSSSRVVLDPGTTIPAPGGTTNTFTGEAPPISVMVPAALLTDRNAIDQANGVAYLVIYTLTATATDGSTARVVAYKRIIGSAKTTKNTNPTLTAVSTVDGAKPLVTYLTELAYPPAAGAAQLKPSFADGSAETYTALNIDGTSTTLTETLTTTWFVSDGTTTYYRTEGTSANGWTPPSSRPTTPSGGTRSIVFVVVTRDGRGGEDYEVVAN